VGPIIHAAPCLLFLSISAFDSSLVSFLSIPQFFFFFENCLIPQLATTFNVFLYLFVCVLTLTVTR
jgi:hypothetical protein